MYSQWIYKSFVQLRKQLYKCKSREELEKYSNIEKLKGNYKTFQRFYNECEEYFWRRFQNEPTEETVQEVFDTCLDWSQRNILLKSIM